MLPLLVAAVVLAGCGSGHRESPASGTTTSGSIAEIDVPDCTPAGLEVWLGLGEGGGTAGSTFLPLEFSNISSHACRLSGFPGVSAYSGGQVGSPASRAHTVPARAVDLPRGGTAHAILRLIDIGNIPKSKCRPVTATQLRVFPPNERDALFVPFSFQACSKPGAIYISVGPLEPGVGIPGHST